MIKFVILPSAALLAMATAAVSAVAERWVYKPTNLLVDANVGDVKSLLTRARACGVTHMLIADSKFSRLHEMPERYFKNAGQVKAAAAEARIELVPALFPVGYSNDLLFNDPNLIEGLSTRDVPLVVKDGVARIEPDATLVLRGGDMSDLKQWGWRDECVTTKDGAAYVKDPNGRNARLSQKLKLQPWRQYHISVRVKANDFRGTPEVKVLAGALSLNHDYLKVERTQDWRVHHAVFNSQDKTEAQVYFGCWDGRTGELWWDDAKLEETTFLNLIRRDGAPLTIRIRDGRELKEGTDFEKLIDPLMGTKPYPGCYTVWHEPPVLRTSLPDGTRLLASWHHAVTIHDDQACLCPSEPAVRVLLEDQARRVHALWQAKGYMMSHDEIRVWNHCALCRSRNLTAGQLLADNVRQCLAILRKVNPGVRIYTWSDMFDPNHNAHDNYYLARGDFAGSWDGLDKDVILMQWNFDKRANSLKFFSGRGHRQVIAGYYDGGVPGNTKAWLEAAAGVTGVDGLMYTTWQNNYRDMEAFFRDAGR